MRSRHYFNDDAERGVDVNMSPLIDIVFLLLIFFIVTAVFVEESGVDVQSPQATASLDLEKSSLQIAVTSDGRIVFDQREISLNLVRGIVSRRMEERQVPVVIQADVESRTGLFVDVQDECRLAGAKQVFIATVAE